MAVITLDAEKNTVTILVEKTDLVHNKEDNMVVVGSGSNYTIGKVFANGEVNLCMVRGER
jgi:ATP-dependent protease HslVU (ClpYQ) peptidase subunit